MVTSDRKQQVAVNGSISGTVPVVAGVPQGSVLGPLLYNDGITCITLSPKSHVTLHLCADNMLLYRPMCTEVCRLVVQGKWLIGSTSQGGD